LYEYYSLLNKTPDIKNTCGHQTTLFHRKRSISSILAGFNFSEVMI